MVQQVNSLMGTRRCRKHSAVPAPIQVRSSTSSHLIIEHESEWSRPIANWDAIDALIPGNRKEDWAKEKERIASPLWWGNTRGRHGSLGGEPLVAHNLHPVGLLAVAMSSRRHSVIANNGQKVKLESSTSTMARYRER